MCCRGTHKVVEKKSSQGILVHLHLFLPSLLEKTTFVTSCLHPLMIKYLRKGENVELLPSVLNLLHLHTSRSVTTRYISSDQFSFNPQGKVHQHPPLPPSKRRTKTKHNKTKKRERTLYLSILLNVKSFT